MGTAVIAGAGALLMKGEKEKADMLNEMFARQMYGRQNGYQPEETEKTD